MATLNIDAKSGEIVLGDGLRTQKLHPLWLRERSLNADVFDAINHQRLYEHSDIPLDLSVLSADMTEKGILPHFLSGNKRPK